MSDSVFIGLGANLGNPTAALLEALDRIDAHPRVSVCRVSTLIRSAPVDVEDQPEFINAVAQLKTDLKPHALLGMLLSVESGMGRKREGVVPRGPRVIDLDIVLWGDRIVDEPGLSIPHPRMHARAFVLLGLVEIDEAMVHPVLEVDMATLLARDIEVHGPIEHRIGMVQSQSLWEA